LQREFGTPAVSADGVTVELREVVDGLWAAMDEKCAR
jgi:hypothetical protein